MMTNDVKDQYILQVLGQETSTFSKYGLQEWGVHDTHLILRES